MRRLFAALALAALAAAAPARAAEQALLWVPAETFSDWAGLDAALSAGSARLTVAVSPALLTPAAARSLAAWRAEGRVEVALRLDGDPLLPVVASLPAAPRAQDVVDRLATARENYRQAFGALPSGFVPGAGAVSPQLFPSLRAMGLSWAAAGDYAGSTGTWAAASGLALVPSRPWPAPDAAVAVIDEADGLAAPGTLLSALASGAAPTATVSEAVAAAAAAARPFETVRDWPTWLGTLAPWTESARSKRAWALYAETAKALERYQNSGLASLKALDRATADLYGAQANRFYRDVPAEQAPALDEELRSRLLAVYRRIHRAPPEALFGAGAAETAEQPSGVHVAQGADWVEFDAPPSGSARAPADASDAQQYTLRALRVETSTETDSIAFVYRLGALSADPALSPAPPAPELGRLLLETYVDINHVMRAGATALLGDRAAFVRSRDAWEFALSVSAWGAGLYRYDADGGHSLVARPEVSVDAKAGEVRVTLSRDTLPGNPRRWGYVAATYEADPASAARTPVRPEAPAEGTAILGLLAPLEQQKALSAPAARPRLIAVRADAPLAN